jgi:hypothetical protein
MTHTLPPHAAPTNAPAKIPVSVQHACPTGIARVQSDMYEVMGGGTAVVYHVQCAKTKRVVRVIVKTP